MRFTLSVLLLLLTVTANAQSPVIELPVGGKLKVVSLNAQSVLVPLPTSPTCGFVEGGIFTATVADRMCGIQSLGWWDGKLAKGSPIMVRVVRDPDPEYVTKPFDGTEASRTALYQQMWSLNYSAWSELTGNSIQFRKRK